MATICVALLRGINVGKAKRVAMADLRDLMEGLGYGDVRTLLNSGNVVFTAPGSSKGAAARIEKAMTAELGVSARVLVLTAAELEAAVAGNRLSKVGTDPSRLFVGFLWETSKALEPLAAKKWGSDVFVISARTAYMWCPNGMIDSPLVQAVNRALGDGLTVRNWATVSKLQALMKAPASPKPLAKKTTKKPASKRPRARR